jgi:hypothetical protein
MSESTRRLKANKAMEGKPCGACEQPMAFAVDAVLCTACQAVHHAECWDRAGGCATEGCENAPLKKLDTESAVGTGKAVVQNREECPHCGKLIRVNAAFCRFCKKATTPDGIYRGVSVNAPGAVPALVFGILGFFCTPITATVALVMANKAKREIANNPTYKGGGMATAGLVLGIIWIVLFGLGLLIRIASRG